MPVISVSSRAVVSGAAIRFTRVSRRSVAALIFDDRRRADLRGSDAVTQFLGVLDRLAVDAEDDIAALAGRPTASGLFGMKAGDERAFGPRKAQRIGDLGGDVLSFGADPGPLDASARLGRLHDRAAPC